MRHGNPPNLDAEPLMTQAQIAETLNLKHPSYIDRYLREFYSKQGIDKPVKIKMTEDL